jgi:phosphoadenosine phosphosulfate reductase
MNIDLNSISQQLGDQPLRLVEWAVGHDPRAITTTNFGPFSAVLLHMVTRVKPDMPIVWMDSGYATPATYQYAEEITRRLNLNLHVYHPQRSRAHREAVDGPPPGVVDPRLAAFAREVKLEPFERARADLGPRVWLTAVRRDQTDVRAGMSPVSETGDGLIKVAPVLGWSSKQMYEYLKRHDLPNNFDYYDPTKVEDRRECGLHVVS